MSSQASPIKLQLTVELVDAIDAARGGMRRQDWIREAIDAALMLSDGTLRDSIKSFASKQTDSRARQDKAHDELAGTLLQLGYALQLAEGAHRQEAIRSVCASLISIEHGAALRERLHIVTADLKNKALAQVQGRAPNAAGASIPDAEAMLSRLRREIRGWNPELPVGDE